ncbi:hypothetical protein SLS59_007844 [Nothophoma quercina]|uniref:Xylanolytic transcriptional activator regulatory domain-containing protein n=1 Tax=Nothophoma quercina TaxID=749835 RepID=A0ABR3QVF6_9PLEO
MGSYENWRKTSALAAALQCANLHQEITVNDNTPFFMAELRKRLFICAYNNDKSSAAFAGRPPKLSRHYCRLQIPLDLTDAQTMSEGVELQAAIAEMDEEGWNQKGVVQRGAFARISATNALITEEILEISLGHMPFEEITRRAADIEARALRSWDELPDFLRVNRFLKKILDVILGSGPAPKDAQPELGDVDDALIGASAFEVEHEFDFMRWLDAASWDQETWIDFT